MKRLNVLLSILIFCCYFSLHIHVLSQPENSEVIINLKEAISKANDDSSKVKLLNDLAWEYRIYNVKETRKAAKTALELAQQINFPRGEAEAWNRIGNVEEALGKYDEAIKAYFSALEVDQQLGEHYGIGRDYHQIAIVYRKKGEFEKAIEHELKSISVLKSPPVNKKKTLALATVYNSLGNVYKYLGQYKNALQYFEEGLGIRESQNDEKGISKSLNEIALVHESMGMYQYALTLHQKSLSIAQAINYKPGMATSYQNMGNIYFKLFELDKALSFYEKSLELKASFSDLVDYHDLIHNMGVLYGKKGEYEQALKYLNQSLEVRESADDKMKMAESYFHIGRINSDEKEYDQAKKFFQKSLSITQSIGSPSLQALILKEMADVYSEEKNSEKALHYYLLASGITDSLSHQERSALDYDKNLLESQHNIRLLEKDLSLEKLSNEKNTILLYSVIAVSVLILISAILSMIGIRNRHRLKIAEQNTQISKKEIDDLLQTQELKLMSAMLEGQDEERNRIAKDLHDRLGGILSIVRLHFKAMEKNIHQLEAQNQEQYALATHLLHEASETVRSISHDIGDRLLMNLGLIPALQDLANTIESSKALEVSVIHHGMKEELDKKIEINLFKIIQELLSNILKHAEAKSITINLIQKTNTLTVMVEDDGKGFDQNSENFNEGMGLLNIRSRIDELNGIFDIDSQPGYGTTITLEVPTNT